MNTRIFLAGLLGGIAMFAWSFVAHDLLPLGRMGISDLSNEQTIRDALRTNLGERQGLFLYPGMGDKAASDPKEAMKEAMEKSATGPSGLIVYFPSRTFDFGPLLGLEFLTDVIEALLAVWLLAQTRLVSYGAKVIFVSVIGFIAAITTNIPYWNWYAFPKRFTAAAIFIQLVGFFLVGLIGAAMVRNRPEIHSNNN